MTTDDTRAARTMAGRMPPPTIVYDYETQLPATDFAYSQETVPVYPRPVTTKPVVRKPISPMLLSLYGLVMLSSAAIAGYVLVVGHHLSVSVSAPLSSSPVTTTPPVTVTAPPSTATVTAVPPPADDAPRELPAPSTVPPSPQEADATFIDLLTWKGFVVTDRPQLISSGHRVCTRLHNGETLVGITDEIAAEPYTRFVQHFTWDDVNTFTSSAYTAYCPGTSR